ncbi:MAG: HD domain-containing protein [Patescibacteria group bacterium]
MIPTRAQCLFLFDRYQLPSQKRIHVEAVTKLAIYFANKLINQNPQPKVGQPLAETIKINLELLQAAALLHDIDKNIPKREGERHPDTAVRVLKELGFPEVAEVVAKHSLHFILSHDTTPVSWEEKLLFLSDKMTKYEVIGVEHRFKLWYKENLSPDAITELDASFPKVKLLEQEIYRAANVTFADVKREFGDVYSLHT